MMMTQGLGTHYSCEWQWVEFQASGFKPGLILAIMDT